MASSERSSPSFADARGGVPSPVPASSIASYNSSKYAATGPKDPLSVSGSSHAATSLSSQQVQAMEAAYEFWQRFDLRGLRRSTLERQGLELKEARDSTLNNRKRLAESTRDFKKRTGEEKLELIDELVKSYQEEIDNLTRRAKGSDAAFLGLYQKLYDAPDPTPLLTTALQDRVKVRTLEMELNRLNREVEEYEEEFMKLKNQDITIRRLEDKVAEYENKMEDQVKTVLDKARMEIHEMAEARVREALEREKRLEDRVKAAQAAQDEAQALANRAQARLFEVSRQAEECSAAMMAEYDLLTQERERHEAEALAARREAEGLRQRLEGKGGQDEGNSNGSNGKKVAALQAELDEMAALVAALRQRLMSKEEEWSKAHTAATEAANKAKEELESERRARQETENELASRPSKEELDRLRGQIRLLHQLEFNAQEDDEEENGSKHDKDGRKEGGSSSLDSVHGNNPEQTIPSVEQLLMGRIRRMETEVMTTRRKVVEAEAKKRNMTSALRESEDKVASHAKLIARLEEDLSRQLTLSQQSRPPSASVDASPRPRYFSTSSSSFSGNTTSTTAGVAATTTALTAPLADPTIRAIENHAPYRLTEQASMEIDINELLATSTSLSKVGGGGSIGGVNASMDMTSGSITAQSGDQPMDLVQILQAQRDRYRARVRGLEGEAEVLNKKAAEYKGQAEQMRRDNMALYEKIRFLQSYNQGQAGGGGRGSGGKATGSLHLRPTPSGMEGMEEGVGGVQAEARYRALYEEQMNPFTAFSAAEKTRKYQDLSVAEKITLTTTRFFLASKAIRSFVFFYALGLHALVFFTLYLWGAHHCDDLRLHTTGGAMNLPPEIMMDPSISPVNPSAGVLGGGGR